MYNIPVKKVPTMHWLNEKGKQIVNEFNNNLGNLVLVFNECPENFENLEFLLEEGRYDFSYPKNNPISKKLKEVIEDSEKVARFFYFDLEDLAV